jgi:hypothetical protein
MFILRAQTRSSNWSPRKMTDLVLEHVTPILNVSSVPISMAWFEQLGWIRSFSWNHIGMIQGAADRDEYGEADYGGVCSGPVEIFLCQGSQGAKAHADADSTGRRIDDTSGVWMTWWLSTPNQVEELCSRAMSLGVPIVMPITRQPWNALEFRIRHPDGHTFRISAFLDGERAD